MDFSVGVGISHFGFDGLLLGPSLVSVTVVLAEFVFEEVRFLVVCVTCAGI